jgi:phage terminase Nu1 subunit (DNA packaging protein)
MNLNMTSAELAKILKMSTRRVNQLNKEGILIRGTDGNYYMPDAVEAYYAYKFKPTEKINYDIEHTLLEKAKRETAEIELELMKGSLIYTSEVEQLMASMILTCKSRLLTMAAKCAPKIIGQNQLAVIAQIINNEVSEALDELRQIPAEKLGACDETDI